MTHLDAADQAAIRATLTADRAAVLGSVSSLTRDAAILHETQTSGENRLRGEGGESRGEIMADRAASDTI